jgi:hypothetical protein
MRGNLMFDRHIRDGRLSLLVRRDRGKSLGLILINYTATMTDLRLDGLEIDLIVCVKRIPFQSPILH